MLFRSTLTGNQFSLTSPVAISLGGTNGTASPTAGAVAYGSGTAYAFTAAGTSGQVLTSNGASAPTWTSVGNVAGPASSTDNAIARFDGTTGKIIQNSGVIVSDTNDVSGVLSLTFSGSVPAVTTTPGMR